MTAPRTGGELSFFDVALLLRRRWRLVLGIPFVIASIVAVVSLIMRPVYTASTTFVPEAGIGSKLPANLAGLAGQFGLGALAGDASRSPRFYAEVLKSRELVERTLLTRYHDPRSGTADSATLLELLRIKGRSKADTLFKGVLAFRHLTSTSVNAPTGVVRLNVDARWPELAAAVANQMVVYLNEFNAKTRQSQARERRRFVEQRITEAENELRAAEGDLRAFYDRNRTWQQSPHLMFEEGRLRRQVDIRQDVYLTLRREFETARIEEVNDTPVITVIDPAVPPQLRTKPRRTLMVLLGGTFGVLVALCVVLVLEYLPRSRTVPA